MRNNYLLFGLLALAACTQDDMPAPEEEIKPEVKPEISSDEKFLAVAPEFKVYSAGKMANPDSRVDVGINGGKISYYWENTDVIGIFPKADDKNAPFNGDQVYFNLNPLDKTDAKQASFDGGGWSVKKGFTYKAYTPFNEAGGFGQDMTQMPVDFTRQEATATGNYLKDKIYMIADGTANADGALQFEFYTITSLGICNINLPEAGTIIRILIDFSEAGIQPFCQQGNFNLEMTGKGNADKAITSTASASYLQLKVDKMAYTPGTPLQIKFVQPPLKGIAGKTAKVRITYISGGRAKEPVIQYTFGQDWKAGNAYTLALDFYDSVNPAPGIDTWTPVEGGELETE